ncbi:MAG TPA: VWA domain-containing protein [Terriglobales bacterium]|jgi:Ca-activated chloride channel family protein
MVWGRKGVLVLTLLSSLARITAGQSSLDEVHITPPTAGHEKPTQPLWNRAAETIRKQVDLVLVPVTVTDERDRLITGLTPGNFQLFDGKKKQEIKHFSSEDTPVSLGIVLDLSGSMASKIEWARQAVMEFCRTANPADEFFLLSFADRPELLTGFTSKLEDIEGRLAFAAPQGRTALLDALYLGLHQMRSAKYPKRALLVISDGGDNRSRYTEREIKAVVKEADVLLYAIAIIDPAAEDPEEVRGPELLNEIASLTGGRAFGIFEPNLLPAIADRVGIELRNQYVLGYRPENAPRNGQWHKIQIKLRIPKSIWPVAVHAKSGYYASQP